jgi:hypothetical protein
LFSFKLLWGIPDIAKKFLVEKAVIRDSEYQNNLADALESLKSELAKIKTGKG